MSTVIQIENLMKEYRLGVIGHGTLAHDLQSWWARVRGKLDPNAKIAPMLAGQEKQIDGDRFCALRDINLEVKQGEVLGIIGKNGAGKSTLLKILSRVTAPTRGNIKVKGRIASLLEVGTGFHPELTGRENIFINGAILGMSKYEVKKKLDEIIEFSGVSEFIDTPVKRYSSGMYVRLAFAVAAHLEPEILVVDEVLAVGDAEFQKKCLGKMGDVASQGRTVLFVSHNMSAITRLCGRAILIDQGQLVANGDAREITNLYLAGASGMGGGGAWKQGAGLECGEGFKLVEVRLLKADRSPVSVLEVSEPLKVEVHYRVEKPGMCFRVVLLFFTEGSNVFSTMEPTESKREQQGLYVSSTRVPQHFFAETDYTVTVSIFTTRGSKQRYALVKDAVRFQVYDAMRGNSARGDYAQNFSGLVRPKLDWHLDFIPESVG